jgi:hypothetical protein
VIVHASTNITPVREREGGCGRKVRERADIKPAVLAEFAALIGARCLVTVVSFDAFAAFIAHTFTALRALALTVET